MGHKEERYTALAKVVMIDSVRKDLSKRKVYHEVAFVEFTDHQGNPAKGTFRVPSSPLYTTIRVGHVVEIEYEEPGSFGGYQVFLCHPERYERVPTEEELAPYQKRDRRVMRRGLLLTGALFITLVLYGVTRSPLVFLGLGVVVYKSMQTDRKESEEEKGKFLSWREEPKDP